MLCHFTFLIIFHFSKMMLRSHSKKKDSEKQKRILAAVTALAPAKKKKVKAVTFDVGGFCLMLLRMTGPVVF